MTSCCAWWPNAFFPSFYYTSPINLHLLFLFWKYGLFGDSKKYLVQNSWQLTSDTLTSCCAWWPNAFFPSFYYTRPVNLQPLFLFWKHGFFFDPEKINLQYTYWRHAVHDGQMPSFLLSTTLAQAICTHYSCFSGIPKTQVFDYSQSFLLFGLRLRSPKF